MPFPQYDANGRLREAQPECAITVDKKRVNPQQIKVKTKEKCQIGFEQRGQK
jgi:hypothetical protein